MANLSVLAAIKQVGRPIFTTSEISYYSNSSFSNTVQTLNRLAEEKVIFKIYRGIWGIEFGNQHISPYRLIPFLLPNHRAYLSFISALHLHGIIEQIPQVVTVASTSHTRLIKTSLGVFAVHRIHPSFFKGFGWYRGKDSFLIAEPEKAFVDCLYLSVKKKKQFAYFPELHFSERFSFKRAEKWASEISSLRVREAVLKKIEMYKKQWREQSK